MIAIPRSPASVSFVIPVRDDAARLSECLESIRANDRAGMAVELVVVDNGSRDASAEVARRAGARVLHRPELRVAMLRNEGAAYASGDILAFVDADHRLDPAWLKTLASCMADPSVAAAGAPYTAPANGTWVQRCYDGFRERHEGRRPVTWLGAGNLAVRRAVFTALGGFDTSLETCEDVDLCQRIIDAGHTVVSDEGLRSTHMGDPATLRALFFGEMWRGRDNLRATWRGPKTLRHLRSALIPLFHASAVPVTIAALLPWAGGPHVGIAFAVALAAAGLSAARALAVARRTRGRGVGPLQAFAVAGVYDLGRATALVARAGHRTRRV